MMVSRQPGGLLARVARLLRPSCGQWTVRSLTNPTDQRSSPFRMPHQQRRGSCENKQPDDPLTRVVEIDGCNSWGKPGRDAQAVGEGADELDVADDQHQRHPQPRSR